MAQKIAILVLATLGTLSLQAAAEPPPDARPTVAVLYFDYAGKDEQMAMLRKGLAQMLISDLSSVAAVRIVERDRLQALLEELKLNQTAKIDPKSANRLGKLLGARYMVLGGYFDIMDTLRADARVVEVETGRIIQSVGANGKPGDFLAVEQNMGEELGKVLATLVPQAKAAPAVPARQRPKAPGQLKTKTVIRYARALDALDRKDRATAKSELQAVVKEQPDFQLAALDLDKLMQ